MTYFKRNNAKMYHALSHPCEDCNIVWHPLVMTFDHRDRSKKFKNINALRVSTPEVFDRELAKCDVVCRNCHQMREYLRDLNVLDIGEAKAARHQYYKKLIPYLCGGAMLRRDALDIVRIVQ